MTYLQLVQAAVRAANTANVDALTTLRNAPGYVRQAADFVNEAWIDVQNEHDEWKWRIREITFHTDPGRHEYPVSGDDSSAVAHAVSATGFRRWLGDTEPDGSIPRFEWLLRLPPAYSAGTRFPYQDYDYFRRDYLVNSDVSSSPTRWSVRPWDSALLVYPIPRSAVRIDGVYVKGVQQLVDDGDVPEGISDEFHEMIKWGGVMKLLAYDGADDLRRNARREYRRHHRSFSDRYLPPVRVEGDFA